MWTFLITKSGLIRDIIWENIVGYWDILTKIFVNMMMMKMMMNCFCGMVDRRKTFSLISSRDHCQRSSPSRISDTPRVGFEPAQNLSSGLVEWSCAVVITTTPRRHKCLLPGLLLNYKSISLSQNNQRKPTLPVIFK